MSRIVVFILLGCCFIFACQPSQPSEKIGELIESIRSENAPDKRVAIWDISPKLEGQRLILKGKTNLPQALDELKTQLKALDIPWSDSIVRLPDAQVFGETIYGIVNLSACNIRSQAKHSGELATQSTLGTTLKLLEKDGDWYRVQTPDGYLGWLDAGGFVAVNEQQLQAWKKGDLQIYLPQSGFAYASPAENSGIVSDLLAGNLVSKTGTQGDFTAILFPDGRKGFVPNHSVENFSSWLDSRAPSPEQIIGQAQQFMGRPYLWGGTSGKGMDCSGFTKTVFYLNGLILPRDASQQVHVGAPIPETDDIGDFQVGDLLFFGRKASENQSEKITHVAIYMGNHKIIHAAGMVKIESLNPSDPDFAPDRLKTFVRAKRMLQDPTSHQITALADSEWY